MGFYPFICGYLSKSLLPSYDQSSPLDKFLPCPLMQPTKPTLLLSKPRAYTLRPKSHLSAGALTYCNRKTCRLWSWPLQRCTAMQTGQAIVLQEKPYSIVLCIILYSFLFIFLLSSTFFSVPLPASPLPFNPLPRSPCSQLSLASWGKLRNQPSRAEKPHNIGHLINPSTSMGAHEGNLQKP